MNNGNWTEWSAIWSEIICVISKSNERAAWVRFEITSMISDQNCNYHLIKSILKSHNFMALNFRFCCIVPSSQFVKNSGTGKALTSYLVCKMMSCDENSFKHNKQTSSSGERKRFISCIKVRFSSPESMMEDFPFFCGWGWDFSLSLGKEFEVAAGVILWWISFELWNSLDCMMPSCG